MNPPVTHYEAPTPPTSFLLRSTLFLYYTHFPYDMDTITLYYMQSGLYTDPRRVFYSDSDGENDDLNMVAFGGDDYSSGSRRRNSAFTGNLRHLNRERRASEEFSSKKRRRIIIDDGDNEEEGERESGLQVYRQIMMCSIIASHSDNRTG